MNNLDNYQIEKLAELEAEIDATYLLIGSLVLFWVVIAIWLMFFSSNFSVMTLITYLLLFFVWKWVFGLFEVLGDINHEINEIYNDAWGKEEVNR